MRTRDLVTGVVTILVGAAASFDARHLPWFGVGNVPGPGFLPRAMPMLLCLLGLLLCVSALRASSPTAVLPGGPSAADGVGADEADSADGTTGNLRGLVVLACFALGVVLLRYTGFLVGMIVMILVILFLVERRRSLWAVVVAVTIPLSAYLLFSHLFAIQLPLGPVTG